MPCLRSLCPALLAVVSLLPAPSLAVSANSAASLAFIPSVTHSCRPIPDSIKIDGILNETGWQGLDTLRLKRNNDPAGGNPSVETKVLTAWSQTRLYVAFIALTKNVRSTFTKHDDPLYEQDVVEMFIDPDGDGKNYLELEWNCLNASLDYSFTGPRAGMNEAWTFDGMQTAVKVMGTANKPSDTDTGYIVEISLPWASLKAFAKGAMPPKAGDSLSLDFFRIDYATSSQGELIAWAPTGAADFHRPDKFGALIFSNLPVTGLFPSRETRFRGPAAADPTGLSSASAPLWRRADGRLAIPPGRKSARIRDPHPVGIFSTPASAPVIAR